MTTPATNTNRASQWGRMLGICIFAAGCFIASLWHLQIDLVSPNAGPENLAKLWPYWISYLSLWTALSYVVWKLCRDGGDASKHSHWIGTTIVVVAILLRVATLLTTTPQLSDDIWRYIHDGRQVANGINPYLNIPAELAEVQPDDPILPRVNHPDLATIYLPTSQIVFGCLWKIHPAQLDPLGHFTFRAGFILFDLLIVIILLNILRQLGRSPWWSIAYAWHPLSISEVAASGHQDVIGIAFVLLAVALVAAAKLNHVRAMAAGVCIVAAGLVKPIVLPLAFPMLWRHRANPKFFLSGVAAGIVTAALLLCPFFIESLPRQRLLETVRVFSGTWVFNSSFHQPLVYLTGSAAWVNLVVGGLLIIVLVATTIQTDSLAHTAQRFFLAALLLSSTVYPWYLLWALAFLPLAYHPATWVFSLTIAWSYAVLRYPTQWYLPVPVVFAQYTPVYIFLLAAFAFSRPNRLARH